MNESISSDLRKARIRRRWNEAAEGYHRWIPLLRRQYAPATDLMLDLARLARGSRVLDMAAGDGDQSLIAAARVGPTGYVLATDLAQDMLAIAESSAREARLEQLETRVMDAEDLDIPDSSFDAVICRFGLGFLPQPDRALAEARRVLVADGWISLAIGAAGGSPQWSVASTIIRRRLDKITPEEPAESGLGDPNVLRGKLETAGFDDVEVHTVSVPLCLASSDQLRGYLVGWYPAAQELLALLSEDEREAALNEVEEALGVYEVEGQFEIPNEVLVAAGRAN